MEAEQQILKPVAVVKKNDTLPSVTDREFWIEQRQALLMQVASIERRLGIVTQRCRFCKSRIESDSR